ncbi:MAG: glycosyltransferase [Acetobacter peroxydans]|nr:glycosyltransferase [Acetobacter peroxydans]MCI2079126.1 glycosyltransferase [Acetobacter peroxydans]
MKIADVSEFYAPQGGGVKTYVEAKFRAADRLGHTLVLIAPGPENRVEPRPGGRIVWVKSPVMPADPRYRMFWKAEPVWRVLDEEKPDMVEGSSPWRGGWLAGQWRGKAPRALFMHADPVAVYPQTLLGGFLSEKTIDSFFGWFWRYLRRLDASYDCCVVAGQWLADRFARQGLERIEVVPFGIQGGEFSPALRDETLRASMLAACGLDSRATLLVTVGRHHPEKRVPMLMRAVSMLPKEQPVGLYVIGDGLQHAKVCKLAAGLPHVHIAGAETDRMRLARMMASADALFHGSTAETFGFVVAEALCSGTPLIVPAAGGAGDLARPAYAETYKPGDAQDAARAIVRFAARDRQALSTAAYEAGLQVGDIERHFDRLFALYQKLVDQKRAC